MMKYTPWVRRLIAPTNSENAAPISIASGQASQAEVTPCCISRPTA